MEFFQTLHLDSFIDVMLWNIVTLFRNCLVFLTSYEIYISSYHLTNSIRSLEVPKGKGFILINILFEGYYG